MTPREQTQTLPRRWRRARPHCGGWWEYRESGNGWVEYVLLTDSGLCVVSDDEWESKVGREPDEVHCENYWEGTDTNDEYMPGLWRQCKKGLSYDHDAA